MTLSACDAEFLRGVVMRNSGNHVDPARNYLFESRLDRLAQERGLESLQNLLTELRSVSGSALQRSVAEAMTINETSFCRDAATFALLQCELLPRLVAARRRVRRLRCWSAACSSGQEAYSLAMLLHEHFPSLASWSIDIIGTDISTEMVARATAGRYQNIEVERCLPPPYRLKYMIRVRDGWQVAPEIRRMCRFEQRNLCDRGTLTKPMDLILLRNVLIYFPDDARRRVLLTAHRIIAPDGVLLLGVTEQPAMDSHWETMLAAKAVWYRPRSIL